MTEENSKVVAVLGDDVEMEHHDLREEERRLLRARWLVANLPVENVRAAVEKGRLEPDTVKFVRETARLVRRIENEEAEPDDLLPVIMDRLEDAFMWTMPYAELTEEQKRRVVGWCRRDGHGELADEIEQDLDEKKKED